MRGEGVMRNFICYGLSLLLGIIYVYLLISGIDPEVPLEYKMYYIDHTLMDWPGYDGLQYESGEKLNFCRISKDPNRVRRRGQGWGGLTSSGCGWTQEQANLYFSELEKKEYVLEASLVDLKGDIFIIANQTKLGLLLLEQDGVYRIKIPAECITENGWLTLSLCLQPYSSDTMLKQLVLH